MGILRNIAAVIIGYLIFAVSAVMLFQISGIDPHAGARPGVVLLVVVFGAVFSFIGGFVAKLIAHSGSLIPNLVLAILIFSFAAFSLARSPGSHYTQIAAMVVFTPISLLGGYFRRKMTLRDQG